jgi:hypothetical protein
MQHDRQHLTGTGAVMAATKLSLVYMFHEKKPSFPQRYPRRAVGRATKMRVFKSLRDTFFHAQGIKESV